MNKCEHGWQYVGITYLTLEEELITNQEKYTQHNIKTIYECIHCGGEKQRRQAVAGSNLGWTEYFSKKNKPIHKHWYHLP